MSVGVLFDVGARGYDRARRQLVPGFDDFYGAVFDLLPCGRNERVRVLDLGAGTGLLSGMVAERFPGARITLVDISREMLEVARRRFSADHPHFDFRVMDYAGEEHWGEYEIVVSALSIHHLEDSGKRKVFRRAYESLSPGGVFVNADQVLGATPEIEERYHEYWLRRTRAAGVAECDLNAALERMKEDRSATLDLQLVWLKEAGFDPVDCAYKDHQFVVYGGYKPGGKGPIIEQKTEEIA
ncbi:MAG: class I SAM-dependent methyltransferase [Actinomycetota bacterium]|nr:class I SAM-dependent methyltransferase [Actinomycetota bacterium]